jgi:hypothetical protein
VDGLLPPVPLHHVHLRLRCPRRPFVEHAAGTSRSRRAALGDRELGNGAGGGEGFGTASRDRRARMISKRGEKYCIWWRRGREKRTALPLWRRSAGVAKYFRARFWVELLVVGGRVNAYVGAGPRQDPTPVKHEFLFLSFLRNEA